LTLPPGKRTVRINFIGYHSAEIEVSSSEQWEIIFYESYLDVIRNSENIFSTKPPVLSAELRNEQDGSGVLYMKDNMPASYHSESVGLIKNIKPSGKGFLIEESKGKHHSTKFGIDYTSSLDISTVRDLPDFPIAFEDFFRTGVSFANSLSIKTPAISGLYNTTNITLGQNRNNSPIPDSYQETYNVSLALKEIKTGKVKSEVGIHYNTNHGRLTRQGNNMARLMQAVYNPPGYANPDPNNLAARLMNSEKRDYLLTYAKTEYQHKKITWKNNLSFDKLWHNIQHNYSREDEISNIAFGSALEWKIQDDYYDNQYIPFINYDFKHTSDKLLESYISDYSSSSFWFRDLEQIRNSHDLRYGLKFHNEWLTFEASNGHYFSNTAQPKSYTNLFPELAVSINLQEFLYDLFWEDIPLSFYGNIRRSIGEAALVNRQPAVLSTQFRSGEYHAYTEYGLSVFNREIKPETYVKSEAGLKYLSWNNRFYIELSGYNYHTHNLVSPAMEGYGYAQLYNIGRLRNYGYFVSFNYK